MDPLSMMRVQSRWQVDRIERMQKPTSSPRRSVNFLGRYRSVHSDVSSGAKYSGTGTFKLLR